MLVDAGVLVVKFWLHLPKKAQRKRLETLEKSPDTAWRVSPLEWKHYKLYGRFLKASEVILRRTDSGHAPWFLVEATDERYRELMVARTLLEALRKRLEGDDGTRRPLRALSPLRQPLRGRRSRFSTAWISPPRSPRTPTSGSS